MLIVYCLKNAAIIASPHGIPELLAILLVAALFLIFKNSLVAIAAGTIAYMLMVQLIFV
ncbi:MAG: AzlD domain-containing protein [Oscillospiraceae bacterium]|jgi:branched-subunit amino acid transport protein AzlD|nr:AzlD domain-containing protein [Oscillospiraceae bacterium]